MRKRLRSKLELPRWDKLLLIGLGFSIACWILYLSFDQLRFLIDWSGRALILTLIYLVFTRSELRPAKSIIYAIMPLVVMSLIIGIVKLISHGFYLKWKEDFGRAVLFGFLWYLAMRIISARQYKALEKERLKRVEIEKENQLTERLRAGLELEVAERTAQLTKQKEELELTLDELKSAQTLLIQSEKMASLGELTAGIAHEIQNPLNFVNNFSEVNTELIAEMNEEIEKGNMEEVKAIARDIAANEQKINHHGKRADAIVKGMLQHSRSSTGVKEPTDINAISDEYLRLAYHGLRAKDKSFNATMKTDFDDSIGKVDVIPQDIGRVVLNLFTNAFYSVAEKKKSMTAEALAERKYEPMVSISTKRINGKVEIRVKDNGNGIPQKAVDKIFQPFFTTKPSGQGTGLGLSLSYDIIKAHGGEFSVNNIEGEGAEFIITLPI